MDEYIDINEFLNYYYYMIDQNTNNVDLALFYLLLKYKDNLPLLNENFQKSFRQADYTDVDIAIWLLLNDAKIFYKTYQNFFNGEYLEDKIFIKKKI